MLKFRSILLSSATFFVLCFGNFVYAEGTDASYENTGTHTTSAPENACTSICKAADNCADSHFKSCMPRRCYPSFAASDKVCNAAAAACIATLFASEPIGCGAQETACVTCKFFRNPFKNPFDANRD